MGSSRLSQYVGLICVISLQVIAIDLCQVVERHGIGVFIRPNQDGSVLRDIMGIQVIPSILLLEDAEQIKVNKLL